MSEKQKKHRDLYKKNREKWIFTQICVAVVLTVAVIISALVSVQLEKQYYISYSERGGINYNVFLKENDFYDLPNVFMTPHIAGSQANEVARMSELVVDQFENMLNGKPTQYEVTAQMLATMA